MTSISEQTKHTARALPHGSALFGCKMLQTFQDCPNLAIKLSNTGILKPNELQQGGTNRVIYGYMRVSTQDQNAERQRLALLEYGVPEGQIVLDKQSGKTFERPAYLFLLTMLQPRDVLVIKSIDRLGRNYDEILSQWRLLTKQMDVSIVVLDMPLLNTAKDRDLTGTLIADIVLQLLSYVAETERHHIHQRQDEGIRAAKDRGVKLGRPRMPKPYGYEDLVEAWSRGFISGRGAGRELGVDHKTFLRWARADLGEEEEL